MQLKFTYLTLIAALFAGTTMAQSAKTLDESYSFYNRIKGYSTNDSKAVDATMTTNGYNSGETLNIAFSLILNNTDAEYGDSISITFPAGFTINSVSNDDLFGPSFDDPDGPDGDPEPFDEINGQTISWGDDDNSWGGITPGELYTFNVNVTVDGSVSGEQTGDYFVSGDGFGADPADFTGTFTMAEGQSTTIFNIVEDSDDHETLEAALNASGLNAVLNDPEVDLTLFAPTDEAFDALGTVVDDLLADPTGALVNVLLYHVVNGTNLSGDLSDGMEVLTLQGETVTITVNGGDVSVNGALVSVADLQADNGVVHVIDAVLVPTTCTVFAGGPYNDFTTTFEGAPVPDENGDCPLNAIEAFESWASEGYVAEGCIEGVVYEFGIEGGASGAWDPSFVIIDAATGEVIASETEGSFIEWTCPADGDYIWIIQEEGLCGNQSENTATDNGFPYMTCNGVSSTSDLVNVTDLSVFPNPANNQFTVELELDATQEVTIDVVNVVGQVVKTIDLGTRSAGLNREYIDVNDLSEGIYMMNITVGATQGTVKVQVVR